MLHFNLIFQAIRCAETSSWPPATHHSTDFSNELSRCYANRSACYFYANEYRLAVLDVDLAISNGFPSDRRPVLYRRKLLCLKSLNQQEEAEKAFQEIKTDIESDLKFSNEKKQDLIRILKELLDQPASNIDYESIEKNRKVDQIRRSDRRIREVSDEIPNANRKLKLEQTDEKGRFIVTSEEIHEHEILISESPIVSWLRPTFYNNYCYHCLREFHHHHLIPCQTCSLVAFCSIECRETATRKYHRIECPHLSILHHFSKAHAMSRLLYTQEHENNGSEGNRKEVDRLISHSNEYSFTMSLETCLGSCFYSLLLQELQLIPLDEDHKRWSTKIASRLMTNLFRLNINCLQVVQQDVILLKERSDSSCLDVLRTSDGRISYRIQERSQNVGYALYSTSSNLNHSCYNTIKSLFDGHDVTFVASCNLKAGEEITFNYGPHYKVTKRQERRKYLQDLYFFTCQCKACNQDWT